MCVDGTFIVGKFDDEYRIIFTDDLNKLYYQANLFDGNFNYNEVFNSFEEPKYGTGNKEKAIKLTKSFLKDQSFMFPELKFDSQEIDFGMCWDDIKQLTIGEFT